MYPSVALRITAPAKATGGWLRLAQLPHLRPTAQCKEGRPLPDLRGTALYPRRSGQPAPGSAHSDRSLNRSGPVDLVRRRRGRVLGQLCRRQRRTESHTGRKHARDPGSEHPVLLTGSVESLRSLNGFSSYWLKCFRGRSPGFRLRAAERVGHIEIRESTFAWQITAQEPAPIVGLRRGNRLAKPHPDAVSFQLEVQLTARGNTRPTPDGCGDYDLAFIGNRDCRHELRTISYDVGETIIAPQTHWQPNRAVRHRS